MITGENIVKTVELFEDRRVKLFHACQLQDFISYLKIGGIPSRNCLEESKILYTPFDTDKVDRKSGVWDKVFTNLSDFGTTFSNGKGATPNPYGPILLEIVPSALLEAVDISVTLRSAGAKDFDRVEESLSTIDEIDCLFVYPSDSRYPYSSYVKYKKVLREDFQSPEAQSPEINCSFPEEILPLKYISQIVVDPYILSGESLIYLVQSFLKADNNHSKLKHRECINRARNDLYNEIANLLFKKTPTLHEIISSQTASDEMRGWIAELQKFDLEYQFIRFSGYLRNGTLLPALDMIDRKLVENSAG